MSGHPLLAGGGADYPANMETGWTHELQGVAHDRDNWFLSQKERIWKIPVTVDLHGRFGGEDRKRGILTASIPPELAHHYDHFCDCDVHDGYLFVPLEETGDHYSVRLMRGTSHKEQYYARIAVFDKETLRFCGSALLNTNKDDDPIKASAPWCAVDPSTGLLYTSRDNDVDALRVYKPSVSAAGLKLAFFGTVPLANRIGRALSLSNLQGGTFMPGGLFCLVSDNAATRGLHVFHTPEWRRVQHVRIPKDSYTVGEELEGITYWNLEPNRAPGISGQVHVLELDNDLDADDLKCFIHLKLIEYPFIGNRRHMELHRWHCGFIRLMDPENMVPYNDLLEARRDGYDGCHFCVGDRH